MQAGARPNVPAPQPQRAAVPPGLASGASFLNGTAAVRPLGGQVSAPPVRGFGAAACTAACTACWRATALCRALCRCHNSTTALDTLRSLARSQPVPGLNANNLLAATLAQQQQAAAAAGAPRPGAPQAGILPAGVQGSAQADPIQTLQVIGLLGLLRFLADLSALVCCGAALLFGRGCGCGCMW